MSGVAAVRNAALDAASILIVLGCAVLGCAAAAEYLNTGQSLLFERSIEAPAWIWIVLASASHRFARWEARRNLNSIKT